MGDAALAADDVVMGLVDPVGEAGGDIPRMAAICADLRPESTGNAHRDPSARGTRQKSTQSSKGLLRRRTKVEYRTNKQRPQEGSHGPYRA